ncbi:MAG: Protein phosphatase PrpC [Fimbriimonadaceae bacterium]|nr:Protein phosphatase PrpC [Fimbriimonadaceae bacterium]
MEEITAEFLTDELHEPITLDWMPRITVGAKTDLGRVRENNEDKFEFYIPDDNAMLAKRGIIGVVCDGMGGHAAGQIASELACKTFLEVYLQHPSDDPAAAGRSAIVAANRFVLDVARAVPARRGMGTTLSAIMLIQNRLLLVHVGDSRVYRFRSGELTQLSNDHTWVEDVVRFGILPREEAEQHANRHMLSRAVGTEPDVPSDIEWFDLQRGDRYLLCSDGIVNFVSDPEIAAVLEVESPSGAAWKLVQMALAGGGNDNATALVFRVDDVVSVADEQEAR